MKKSSLLIFSTLFLFSFQSSSAPVDLDGAIDIYEEAQQTYDNAYDIMTNESDFVSRRELDRRFLVDNSAGGPEDTTKRERVFVKGEREDYRRALLGIYANCSGEAGKLEQYVEQGQDPETRDEISRARSLYLLCARQAEGELNHFF